MFFLLNYLKTEYILMRDTFRHPAWKVILKTCDSLSIQTGRHHRSVRTGQSRCDIVVFAILRRTLQASNQTLLVSTVLD